MKPSNNSASCYVDLENGASLDLVGGNLICDEDKYNRARLDLVLYLIDFRLNQSTGYVEIVDGSIDLMRSTDPGEPWCIEADEIGWSDEFIEFFYYRTKEDRRRIQAAVPIVANLIQRLQHGPR
jgi:hypothetical protein